MTLNHKDMSKKRFGAHTAISKKDGFELYRKKPLIIQAKQMNEPFEVVTLEGKMTGKAGDYLIIGIKGESYPCDKTVFELTYELVGSEKCLDCESFSYRDNGRKEENYGFCPTKGQWVTDTTRCSTVKNLKKGEQEK